MVHNKQYIAEQAKIFKALGHPTRLLMVDALRDGEKCVCELQSLVGDDMSTISRHLAVLREAGIISSDKRGTNIYYKLSLLPRNFSGVYRGTCRKTCTIPNRYVKYPLTA